MNASTIVALTDLPAQTLCTAGLSGGRGEIVQSVTQGPRAQERVRARGERGEGVTD